MNSLRGPGLFFVLALVSRFAPPHKQYSTGQKLFRIADWRSGIWLTLQSFQDLTDHTLFIYTHLKILICYRKILIFAITKTSVTGCSN